MVSRGTLMGGTDMPRRGFWRRALASRAGTASSAAVAAVAVLAVPLWPSGPAEARSTASAAAPVLKPLHGLGVIADAAGRSLTPLDLNTTVPNGAISIGPQLFAVAITPDGSTALAARYGSTSVVPVTIAGRKIGAPIPVGKDPSSIAVNPNGLFAYVTNRGSATVTKISLTTDTSVKTYHLPRHAQPEAIAVTPDGTKAFVADEGLGRVTPINLETNTVMRSIRVGSEPAAVAASNKSVFVANFGSATVSQISPISRRIVATYSVGAGPDGIAILLGKGLYVACYSANETDFVPFSGAAKHTLVLHTGVQPTAIAISGNGQTVYVANYDNDNGSLVTINTATQSFETPPNLGKGPIALSIDPAAPLLYVANYGSGVLTVVRTSAVGAKQPAALPGAVGAVAIAPGGRTAWGCVASAHEIVPMKLSSGTVGPPIVVGGRPDAIAITISHRDEIAWVADYSRGTLDQVDLTLGKVLARIKVGSKPVALALTANRTTLWVVDQGSDRIVPVTLTSLTRGAPIGVGSHPTSIAISPDGATALVVDRGDGAVTPVNLLSRHARIEISLPGVSAVAFGTPTGVYAVSTKTNKLYAVHLEAHVATPIAPIGLGPDALVVEDQRPIVIVVDRTSDRVIEFDLQTNRVLSNETTGRDPVAIAIHTLAD
jgi:YVTN family beta-propeller protein